MLARTGCIGLLIRIIADEQTSKIFGLLEADG
jgi:hypothetical protein